MVAWLYLVIAIVLEVAGTTCMKLFDGFACILPSIGVGVFYLASKAAMVMAVKALEIRMVCAIWSGLGTVIITAIGILYFGESFTLMKAGSITLIIVGVIGLQISSLV